MIVGKNFLQLMLSLKRKLERYSLCVISLIFAVPNVRLAFFFFVRVSITRKWTEDWKALTQGTNMSASANSPCITILLRFQRLWWQLMQLKKHTFGISVHYCVQCADSITVQSSVLLKSIYKVWSSFTIIPSLSYANRFLRRKNCITYCWTVHSRITLRIIYLPPGEMKTHLATELNSGFTSDQHCWA